MAKLTFLCIFADTFTEGLIFLFLLNDILLLFEHRFLWLYFIFDTEMVKKISNEWNFLRMSLKTTLRKKYQIKFNSLKIILKFYLKLNFISYSKHPYHACYAWKPYKSSLKKQKGDWNFLINAYFSMKTYWRDETEEKSSQLAIMWNF